MHLKGWTTLCVICLMFSCSLLKKDKTTVVKRNSEQPAEILTETADTLVSIQDTMPVVAYDTVIPPPVIPKKPLEYMTIEEKAMLDEINLLRADPHSYIQHIDQYLQDFMEDANWDFATKQTERSAGEELIQELRTLVPLPLVKPSEELYKVAKRHGMDMKANNFISHQGSDDSLPEDRIRDSTSLVGSENLVAGGRSVRESLIMLLVDANDRASRGHRKTILDTRWEFAACYYAGTVDGIPNTWVQLFAINDPKELPEALPVRSLPEDTGQLNEKSPASDAKKIDANEQNAPFMTALEREMIEEINLLRSNPKGYAKYVDIYVNEMKKVMFSSDPEFDRAVKELQSELSASSPLSILKAHQKLYEVAKAHGIDNKTHHQLEHKGSDKRQSFDRVKDAGLKNNINKQGIYTPNENLIGGEASVRNSVIALLIDSGIPNRGHRRALLEPAWTHVACYHIGTIADFKDLRGMENDDMENCWVQFFAKD